MVITQQDVSIPHESYDRQAWFNTRIYERPNMLYWQVLLSFVFHRIILYSMPICLCNTMITHHARSLSLLFSSCSTCLFPQSPHLLRSTPLFFSLAPIIYLRPILFFVIILLLQLLFHHVES